MKREKIGTLSRRIAGEASDWVGKHVPLRHRYLFTRHNRLRLRFVASPIAAVAVSLFALSSFPTLSPAFFTSGSAQIASSDPYALDNDQAEELYAFYSKRMGRYSGDDDGDNDTDAALPSAPVPAPAAKPHERIIEIGEGDTLTGLLEKAGVAADEAYQMVEALKKTYDPRNLRPGQKVAVRLEPEQATGDYNLAQVNMPIDAVKSVSLEKKQDGTYKASVVEKQTETRVYAHGAKIESSLYGSGAKAGIPSAILGEMIRIYSYNVDLQRDLRKGDVAEAMYDQVETKDGDVVKTGNLIFAKLVIDGRSIPIYRYEVDGIVDYYDAHGQTIRKALMRTPVDGARISSGFGMRMHPVLGFTKMHKGIDFAAPVGTPIYAAGNGVVEKCGPFSTYGNYIKIRHNGTMETAYAHMSRFAQGIRSGVRVRQGEVIGYIGATGRVTGAHLHYEVLMGGSQVNPSSIKTAQADALRGKALAVFKAHIEKIDHQYAALSGDLKYAAIPDDSEDTAMR